MTHEEYMREALLEAEKGQSEKEIPVGCIIVKDGEIIARAHNSVEAEHDPLAHAEMNAMREAIKKTGWRLVGCDMYVSLEPCPMCKGAITWARLDNVYVGTKAEKDPVYHTKYSFGILQEECYNILVTFFKNLRRKK